MKKLAVLFIIPLLLSCTRKPSDLDVVLQIEDLKITHYTIKKKVDNAFPDPNLKNAKTLEAFKNELINSYYIIVDAYNKKYDTISLIQDTYKHNIDRIMIERGGPLWNKQVGQRLYDSTKITPERIRKRSKLLYFDVIGISNKEGFLKLVDNDTIMENEKEFEELKKLCPDYLFLNSLATTMQWPYLGINRYTDYFDNMKPGDISDLLTTATGYYYYRLVDSERVELTPEEKDRFRYELHTMTEQFINDEKDREMLNEGKLEINEKTVNLLLDYIYQGNDLREYSGNPHVMSYYLGDELKKVHFQEFIIPSKYYPLTIDITSEQTLRKSINDCFFYNYLAHEARELGLYETEFFKIDCKDLLNRYIYYEYLKREFDQQISIDTSEVEEFYMANKKFYKEPAAYYYNCYFFDDEFTASSNWHALMDFYANNDLSMMMSEKHLYNMRYSIPEHKINMQESEFNSEIKMTLRNLQLSQVSTPIPYKEKYALFCLMRKEGEVVRELDNELYIAIEYQLIQEKKSLLMKERHNKLKEEYTLKVEEIDTKYL